MKYIDKIEFIKNELINYATEIFKVYGNELLLRLEEYNLLSNPNNCIESSTATGFIMEEFITSKLAIYTKNHDNKHNLKILKLDRSKSTVDSSYDCYSEYEGVSILINIKVEKEGSHNNGVAAINILHRDYVITKPKQEKTYCLLKTNYKFDVSKRDHSRKIMITGLKAYCLEELDFSKGHIQDNRNWSADFKKSSGRLQVTTNFLKNSKLPINEISYNKTFNFIDDIFKGKL